MAKQKQEATKPRYHAYCHECKSSFDVGVVFYVCKCKGIALTITDHDKLTSGYFVKGVKNES